MPRSYEDQVAFEAKEQGKKGYRKDRTQAIEAALDAFIKAVGEVLEESKKVMCEERFLVDLYDAYGAAKDARGVG